MACFPPISANPILRRREVEKAIAGVEEEGTRAIIQVTRSRSGCSHTSRDSGSDRSFALGQGYEQTGGEAEAPAPRVMGVPVLCGAGGAMPNELMEKLKRRYALLCPLMLELVC